VWEEVLEQFPPRWHDSDHRKILSGILGNRNWGLQLHDRFRSHWVASPREKGLLGKSSRRLRAFTSKEPAQTC